MDKHLQRALVLIEQSRYELAEQELRQVLASDPDDAMAHAFLALCLAERDDLTKATNEAQTAVHLAPDWPTTHAMLARIYLKRNRFDEAQLATEEAIRLDPSDADHYALLASVRMAQENWPLALEATERGLALDAEHVQCNNLRAMALTKLGRTAEAGATIAATLARDPEDSFSHANQGWTYLHEGNSEKALNHFREALRIEPGMDYARAGMVEALQSRNIIYALMLKYFLWMSRISSRARWLVILGAYLGFRALDYVGDQNPALKPFVTPLLIAYVAFAIMTWIAAPLFNLLLRFSRYGRYALSRDQIWASNLVAVLLVPAVICLIVWVTVPNDIGVVALGLAVYFGVLLLPVTAIFNCDRGWPRWSMTLYTLVLAALGPLSIAVFAVNRNFGFLLMQAFLLGTFLSGFAANFLMMATAKR